MGRSLKHSVVVVTGASSGIGRAAALRFAKKGASVALAARRGEVLEGLARECRKAGGRAIAVPTDVTVEDDVGALAKRTVEEFGRIDVWVNNAAVSLFGRFDEAPADEYDRVIDTNLLGYVRGIRAVLPYFREQGHGVVINNASVYGKAGAPYLSAYVASKFGVVGLGESLRQELIGDRGITVSTILPASIDTPLFQHAANYTGRKVKPLRPVHDADVVAKAIVRCARKPRRERIVGGAGRMLFQQRMMSPGVFEKMQARLVDRDHFEEVPEEPRSGNVNEPVAYGTGVSGGWPGSPGPLRRKAVLVAAAGTAASVVGLQRTGAGKALVAGLGQLAPLLSEVVGGASRQTSVTGGVNPVVRAARDLGMAAWFGGTLMGATAINRAAADISDPTERLRFVDRAWDRWTVPGAAAITAHLVGSALAGWGNKSRALGQQGMATQMAFKGGLSAAALGATAAARMFRKRALRAVDDRAPVHDATTPAPGTPEAVAQAQRLLRVAEVAVPALTGTVVALNARMSEQQRPVPTLLGIAHRLRPAA